MTSPFVDRVEYQVIGRDVNASGVFRDVASAADAAGDSINGLGTDLDRVNRSIESTADRMRQLLASLQDLTATREITVTTNVREVLGSVEDNREVLDLINDRFESLTVNVVATVNQLVQLNDGLVTIDDNRTAVIDLGDDVRQLTQNIDATVDSIVELNDGIQTINDNRAAVITLGDDVLALTQNVDATVDSVVSLNDGLQTINDNRTAVITLGDDVLTLTQNIDATVDSIVELNDGIQTIDDNRAAVITLGDDVLALTQNIDATVDSVVSLNDGIQTIDDNRAAVITLGDDVRTLTQNIDATVDSVVDLNDGIQTIDDNRTAIVTVDDDFRQLTQNIDATVDSVVNLNDGIQTIDDNRVAIVTVDDDFRTLTQDIDGTVNSIVNLNDGITTVDDNRTAITGVGDDFRTLGDDIDNTRTVVIRFNDEVDRVDDNRAGLANLGTGFDDLSTAVERSRGRVTDLDRDLRNLPGGQDINNDIDVTRRVVETVSSDRDRWERAGLIGGAALAHGALTAFGLAIASGLSQIPIAGGLIASVTAAITAAAPEVTIALAAVAAVAAAAAGVVAANAFTGALLLGLGGGVIVVGLIAAFSDPILKAAIKGLGESIKVVLTGAVKESGFTSSMVDSIAVIRQGFIDMRPAITEMFRAAGPLIKPLVDGMMGLAREALPGVTAALRNMKPVFDVLAEHGPKLGKIIGEFFEKISKESPNAAQAFDAVLDFVEKGIDLFGDLLVALAKLEPAAEAILRFFGVVAAFTIDNVIFTWQVLAKVIGWVADAALLAVDWFSRLRDASASLAAPLGNVNNFLGRMLGPLGGIGGLAGLAGGALGLLGGKSQEAGSKVSGLGSALGPAAAALAIEGAKAAGAATDNQKLADSIKKAMDAANAFIGLGDAQSQMYEAMERGSKRVAEASGKDLKKGIDLSTAAGRENWRALRDIAAGANAAAGDITTMGGSAADAASVVQIARQKFIEVAGAMGIAAGDARILADKMFGIPDADPTVNLQDKATKGINGINGKLGAIDRYNAMPSVGLLDNATRGIGHIQNLLYKIDGDSATVTVNVKQNGSVSNPLQYAASGGPVWGPGQKGVDSKLYMLAPGEHILTAREVDAAGGHANIMEFRRSLLNKAHPPRVAVEDGGVRSGRSAGRGIDANTLRQALSGMTLVIDDRTGRTAQLIARGG